MKRVLAILLLTCCILGCTACGSSKTAANSNSDTEQITLTMKSYFVLGDNAEAPAVAFNALLDQYLEEHPNVTIEKEFVAHDSYEQKIMVDFAGEELPDLFQLKSNWMNQFVGAGLVGDVNSLFEDDPAWLEGFSDGALNEFTYSDGKLYGVPYTQSTSVNVFYNSAILEECGYSEMPATLEEFDQMIEDIRAHGYIPITAGNKGGWFADVCIFRGLLDRYAGDEWNMSLEKNQGAKFTDPEFVNALKHLEKWVAMGAFNSDINSIDYMQGRTNFYNGKAAMMFDGSGGILPYQSEAPQEILDVMEVAKIPDMEGGKGTGIPGVSGWSVAYNANVSEEKLAVIKDILKMVGSSDFANIVAENCGTPAYATTDYDQSQLPPLMQKYNALMEEVPLSYQATLPQPVLEELYAGIQGILIQETDAETVAQAVQKAYEKEMGSIGS